MHGSGEFLVTDRYGETVPKPFGVVRRNDFIRSRGQNADRAGDFGRGQVRPEVVRKEKPDGQVRKEAPGSLQKAVKRDQQHQFFHVSDGGYLGSDSGTEALPDQDDVVRRSSGFLQQDRKSVV